MTALNSLVSFFNGASVIFLIIALAVLLVIWRLANRAEYQKTSFFCRLFGFSIETRMRSPKRSSKIEDEASTDSKVTRTIS
jgi:hypothetical protein